MQCNSVMCASQTMPDALLIVAHRWTVPTTIGVPILNGSSFFGQFMASIGSNLAHFPTGPKLDDPFWLYLTVSRDLSDLQWLPLLS